MGPMTADADVPHPDGASSGSRTTRRRGRMSEAKWAVLADDAPRWTIAPAAAGRTAGLVAGFGRDARRLLDVGAGNGAATLAWAAAHPDRDVLAVELHRPGLVQLVRALDAGGPANVRVVEADVTVAFPAVEPGAFHDVRVLFPDPWPKRRHVGRRLVDPTFVAWAADLLLPGGTLHLATDWDDYAEQMRAVFGPEPRFRLRVDAAATAAHPPDDDGLHPPVSARPDRPVTAYERRGLRAGRAISDLVFDRVEPG